MALTEDISWYIETAFRPEDRATAIKLLSAAVIEDGSPASPRLLRCAVIGAEGSICNLEHLVGLLRIDWRDVVMAGEYVYQGAEPVQVRDLNVPITGGASNISFKADGSEGPPL